MFPFLRHHTILAKEKSINHLETLLLSIRRSSLLISDFLLFMIQKWHIKMQMASRKWTEITRVNLLWTAGSVRSVRCAPFEVPEWPYGEEKWVHVTRYKLKRACGKDLRENDIKRLREQKFISQKNCNYSHRTLPFFPFCTLSIGWISNAGCLS